MKEKSPGSHTGSGDSGGVVVGSGGAWGSSGVNEKAEHILVNRGRIKSAPLARAP